MNPPGLLYYLRRALFLITCGPFLLLVMLIAGLVLLATRLVEKETEPYPKHLPPHPELFPPERIKTPPSALSELDVDNLAVLENEDKFIKTAAEVRYRLGLCPWCGVKVAAKKVFLAEDGHIAHRSCCCDACYTNKKGCYGACPECPAERELETPPCKMVS